jgi:hypothetical protein
LLHKDQGLRRIPFRQNARRPEPQAAANHGEQKDKHESPPDNCDDIFRADFLMNHLSFSCGYFAAASERLNYHVLAANGSTTIFLIDE